MSLVYNGKIIATNSPQTTISRAEYDALPPEVKNDPSINFFIYDDEESDYERLLKLSTAIGASDALKDYADGTVIGALKDIYDRLGGLSFAIDPEFNHVEATYSDENPNNVIQQLNDDASVSEKIEYLNQIVGDVDQLGDTGFDTIVAAILDIYGRLNDLSFAYRADTDTVEVTDNQ